MVNLNLNPNNILIICQNVVYIMRFFKNIIKSMGHGGFFFIPKVEQNCQILYTSCMENQNRGDKNKIIP